MTSPLISMSLVFTTFSLLFFKIFHNSRATVMTFLDGDGDGNVSVPDMTAALESLADARVAIFAGQRNRTALAHFAAFAVDFVFWVVTVIVAVTIFGENPSHFFVPFATVLAASSFVFGEFLSGLFFSCVLLFWVAPFTVGEVIQVSGFSGTYAVRNITIPSTHCRALSGETVVFPNSLLAKTQLRNLSRCGGRIKLEFQLLLDGTKATIQAVRKFETRVVAWLAARPGRWSRDIMIDVVGILDRCV
jgi:small-conductance mechanosensitive channel